MRVNPADIQSIGILKMPSAYWAIYDQGRLIGVILVTTKKGAVKES